MALLLADVLVQSRDGAGHRAVADRDIYEIWELEFDNLESPFPWCMSTKYETEETVLKSN